MTPPPPQRFVVAQILLMLTLLCWFALTDLLRIDHYLVISLSGFILLWEFTSPVTIKHRWRTRLRWVVFVGYAIFAIYALYVTYSMLTASV